MTPLRDALEHLASGQDLTESQAHAAMAAIIAGEASEVEIAALLTALRVKGETADALAGAVRAVRERMTDFWDEDEDPPPLLLDTCGTGGDGARSINISTATALVVAACGVPVAKHGNRSASGVSGSAEVLTELGIAIDAERDILRHCLDELGITFLFAPRFHPALRHAAPVRRQLPFRTLFNLVGPLANPARPDYQLIGVPGERVAELMAQTLARLGIRRAAVVAGAEGLDEVSLAGANRVRWVEAGRVATDVWEPEDFGLPVVRAEALRVTGPSDSAAKLRQLLDGQPGPIREVVLANAAAALFVAGRVNNLQDGVARAAEALDSGTAATLLDRWRTLSAS